MTIFQETYDDNQVGMEQLLTAAREQGVCSDQKAISMAAAIDKIDPQLMVATLFLGVTAPGLLEEAKLSDDNYTMIQSKIAAKL